MKSWKLEFRLVESGKMLARLANWQLDGTAEANSPERAITVGFRKYKKELNGDKHLRRAKRLGGLRIKVVYLGEVGNMKMTEAEIQELVNTTGRRTSRKCDNPNCGKPIFTSHVVKPFGIEAETCSAACAEEMEQNANQPDSEKESTMKSKGKGSKKSKKSTTVNTEVAELEVAGTDETTETQEAATPKKAKATKKAEKPAKAAKPAKATKKVEEDDSPRKQLMAVPYSDRMKGKFDAAPNHAITICLGLLGGTKGGKTVKLKDLQKACPADTVLLNTLNTISWYGNPKNVKDGVKGFGGRVKVDTEAGTATLVKAE